MNSIDEQIRKALTAEDQKAIEEIDEEENIAEAPATGVLQVT